MWVNAYFSRVVQIKVDFGQSCAGKGGLLKGKVGYC